MAAILDSVCDNVLPREPWKQRVPRHNDDGNY